METFFKFCTTFVTGIAEFFNLQIPYIGISFLQLFGGFLIIKAVIVGIKIIFGTDHGGDVT